MMASDNGQVGKARESLPVNELVGIGIQPEDGSGKQSGSLAEELTPNPKERCGVQERGGEHLRVERPQREPPDNLYSAAER